MASLIFYVPLITPHPPHSLGHLLTVPHLHFNKGGSQTFIPSSFMSLDCFSILPHAPQPTGKSRERGIPPCFCHICHICLHAILGIIPMEGRLQYTYGAPITRLLSRADVIVIAPSTAGVFDLSLARQ